MTIRPEERRGDSVFPPLNHCVIAAATLFLLTQIVPLLAGLT